MDLLKSRLILCTNASDRAIGVIMMLEGMVIAYESIKVKKNVELNYLAHEKDFLMIIHASKVWRHNLLGSEFKLRLIINHYNI